MISVVILAASLVDLGITTTGRPRVRSKLAHYWGARPWRSAPLGPRPPITGHWPFADLAARIVQQGVSGRGCQVFVGPGMLAPPMGFARARFWPDRRVRFFQTGSPYWGRPFPINQLLTSDWIVVTRPLDRWSSQDPYQRALTAFLQTPPKEFSETHRLDGVFSMPDGGRLELLRRVQPLTVRELDSCVAHMPLDQKYLTNGTLLAARLLVRDGKQEEAIARLHGAAKVPGQPPKLRARILGMAATVLARADRVAEARRDAEEAIRVDPENAQARRLLDRLERSTQR